MSPRAKAALLPVVSWAALLVAFSVGGAWASATTRITKLEAGKLDRTEAATRDSALVVELRYLRTVADQTSRRVSAMYCEGKPAGCQ